MDIDTILQAVITDVGRRLAVDRCNVITPSPDGGFRVSHEFLGDPGLKPGLGFKVPTSMVPFDAIKQYLPKARPFAINDTHTSNIPFWVKGILQLIGTRSILVAPFVHQDELLGVMGLHYCRAPHQWEDSEVKMVEGLANHVTLGLQYAKLFDEKEKEIEITKLLLEISNDINSRSDFSEITDFAFDRALDILKADYGCIAILNNQGDALHFDELRARRGFDLRKSVELKFREPRVLRLPDHETIRGLLQNGNTLRLEDSRGSALARYVFSHLLKGQSALITTITIKEKVLGIIALVWYNETAKFSDFDVQILNGISSQIAVALDKDRLAAEVIRLKRELNDFRSTETIIGSSSIIKLAIENALSVADSETTVLIQGESGTGKELIAGLIQSSSRRASRPFVKLNCGAIPQSLLESELFGHERGAFTDARSRRIGKFEEADGGTLFLDEIGEMSLAAQVSLLRVLQDGEFTRIGGNEVVKTDVRVITATNKDLEKAVEDGSFRRDLYYRLNVYPITLPPLRERTEDIEPLIAYFTERFRQKSGKSIMGISDRAIQMLKQYPWPGNIRELENCIERAAIVAAGRSVTEKDLTDSIRAHSASSHAASVEFPIPMKLEDVERSYITRTLEYTNGDKAKAARLLGIGRKTIYRKIEEFELEK